MDKADRLSSAYNAFSVGYCLGLVNGVSDTITDMMTLCDPGTTYGQQVRIVVKYLDDHPEKLNLKATVLIKLALLNAFGCKASKLPHSHLGVGLVFWLLADVLPA